MTCGLLSGNRHFEGRLCDCVRANYLASPPLVVAYAIAGTVGIDFEKEPLGKGGDLRVRIMGGFWCLNQSEWAFCGDSVCCTHTRLCRNDCFLLCCASERLKSSSRRQLYKLFKKHDPMFEATQKKSFFRHSSWSKSAFFTLFHLIQQSPSLSFRCWGEK